MNIAKQKKSWYKLYKSAPEQLQKMSGINGMISAFNANTDAVLKISGKQIESLIKHFDLKEDFFSETKKQIIEAKDLLSGLFHCFSKGIAEEWIISDETVFGKIQEILKYDKLQMGGQGGIVANVAAVCGVKNVFVHCASLPEMQAKLFLDLPNLLSVDENKEIKQANKIHRKNDIPLIHYILEFDINDSINFFGKKITCPKSNRFIATFDPLNFKMHIDKNFEERLSKTDVQYEFIILSGYQMLREKFTEGFTGKERIDRSLKVVEKLKNTGGNSLVHFEIASTQDKTIRKYLIDKIASNVESIGFNERELIDILEVIKEDDLAAECDKHTNSVNLFRGMLKIFEYTSSPRIQLHMFGLYITLQKKSFQISPEQNRKGMQTAAVIAAGKAGTGTLEKKENLLWAKDEEVSDIGLKELSDLSEYIEKTFAKNELKQTGIFEHNNFDVIAIPTIIIDKPVTLVGMGDTISSVSLLATE
jgi:ADP-dependent phosphofructokinase/glucokinase